MKQSFIQLYLREKKTYLLLVGITLFIVVLLLGYIYEQNKHVQSAQALSGLIESSTSSSPGATCTILTMNRAKIELGSSVDRSYSNLFVPSSDGTKLNSRHLDSCRYVSQTDSNLYIEFFITTYDDAQIAAKQYESNLPVVSDIEELDASVYDGEKLSYDGGVHYLLRDRQTIEVAASNGSTARQKNLSRELLDEFESKIQPL